MIANRTLELLSLLQAQKEWTGDGLAERLGVSPRTVRRDINRLRELGYPVTATKGPSGYYRLSRGARLPPLIVDDEQAIAIALSLQTAPASVAGMGDATKRALNSIRELLPPHLSRRLATFSIEQIENAWELAPPQVDPGLVAQLSAAAQERELVRFTYRSIEVDEVDGSEVLAEPHRLVVWSGRWYMVAFDQRGCSWRAYRLDRIEQPAATGWRFAQRDIPERDITRFVQSQPDRGDTPDTWPCWGTVLMECPAALVAKWAPGAASFEAVDERITRIRMGAWSWSALIGFLVTFSCRFTVESPPELAEAARRVMGRIDVDIPRADARAQAPADASAQGGEPAM
ncbi:MULTISPECIES: helix-turn-helix transcriptional regulator [unclassified Streptomyces]|uniref:helix-turn-helix transcriptional regulator n=1 Tax=unclassified Streptomyces TaxID=2593676 RepID=UPI00288811C6|nr:WYL domain-containing protein [Streptomyces sp. DSM 41633]